MSQGYWFIIADPSDSAHVKTHWMSDGDLERFNIKGKVGEEYILFDDDPDSKRCIVGQIGGRAAELLDCIVNMIDVVEGSTTASQELRFNIIDELVQDITRAVIRRVLP